MVKKSWWQRKFGWKPKNDSKIDIVKDSEAIRDVLSEIKFDVEKIVPQLEKLEELEKERKVATSGIIHVNLETQADVLDKLLKQYQFLQDDIGINGLRLRAIANQFLKNAKSSGMKDLVEEKQRDRNWKFFW
jgi:hypothetical protein